jgi:hypothetical protein
VSGNYAVFETNCDSVAGLQVGSESSEKPDIGYSYPFGLAGFYITCAENGDTARIRQYYYGVEGSELYTVRKWMNDGSYREISGAQPLGMSVDDDVVFLVEYNITDGGEYDDDSTQNGVVVDPSGAALADGQTAAIAAASSPLASTGQSTLGYLKASLALALIGVAVLSLRKRIQLVQK